MSKSFVLCICYLYGLPPAYFLLLYISVLECLTTQDVNGETALHSAANSKASGFVRFYAKLLTNDTQVLQQSTENVLQLLDLKYNKVILSNIICPISLFVEHK